MFQLTPTEREDMSAYVSGFEVSSEYMLGKIVLVLNDEGLAIRVPVDVALGHWVAQHPG